MTRDNPKPRKVEHGLSSSRDYCLPFLNDLPTPIWRSGIDGRCDYCNRTRLDFTGRSLEEEIGEGWIRGVHPDDVERVLKEYRHAFARRELFALEYRLRRHDGEYRQIVDYGKPYQDLGGEFAGYIGECYDNTEREGILAQLRKSEAQFAQAQALAHLGSWEWDLTTHTSAWSDEHYRIMGLKPQEAPQNYDVFMSCIHPDDRDRIHEDTLRVQRERTPHHHEFRIVLPGGEIRFLQGRGSFALDETGQAVRMFGTIQDITERKRAEAALREANEKLQLLSRRLITMQEDERRGLAQKLHDEIGQTLTAVKIGLQTAQASDDLPATRRHTGDSVALVDQVLRQVREIALELRPSTLDHLGLVPALRWYFDQQRVRSGLKIDFRHLDLSPGISAEIQTACYRIAQEAMTNILRHAQAQNVVVELRELNGALEFSMKDDGVGFDFEHTKSRASLGLVGMKERALLVGGSLDVTSPPTKGTTLLARLPLTPVAE